MKFYFLIFMAFIFSGCTAVKADLNFCDGWSTDDGSGESVLWIPNEKQRQIILEKLGSSKIYICAEQNPSGRTTVVSFGHSKSDRQTHHGHIYSEKDGKLTFIDEGIFVSSH